MLQNNSDGYFFLRPFKSQLLLIPLGFFSIAMILLEFLSGDKTLATNLIAAIGTIVQAGVAILMWRLSKQQHEAAESFADYTKRSESYERRYKVQEEWSTYSKEIGITFINYENVYRLKALKWRIKYLFDDETYNKARNAITSAQLAERRAKRIFEQGGIPRFDTEYRRHIGNFRENQRDAWFGMQSHLLINGGPSKAPK